ncbi:2-oxoacid:ferredoxin oxidoreductase subunit beta [Methanoplanus sp. FWC-SCC4]|uniref:2-oxoacid:ferredoxin oxidoreductase subunit beta n=1 Tax=Methanochimaera problematica TaxID=2609417 RepID=A0AA97FEA1_9EURY|nr:thiamine pyrophosphate-dependent enzyme [Methanoplanus sp. FWC-SCC4]WOF15861.1 2-oxoacid:ferredoxin oxidoreductase subunit beta [Methanoplanus sp. FWC-SCC4]
MKRSLITQATNTWCTGCGNFKIQHTLKSIIEDMESTGVSADDIIIVAGIGCHGKIADYMNVNTLYSLHGRAIPFATGIKVANPDLKVICCVGDGDAYAEGLDHLIFAAKRNVDITVIVHNNRVYGLTTGQYTPTSPLHYKGKSTPQGSFEKPINPIEIMLSAGATYVARGYTEQMKKLKEIVSAGINHKGFSFIDILQICASYFEKTDYYDNFVYNLTENNTSDLKEAFSFATEWNYNNESKIPLGIFYNSLEETFEDKFVKKSQSFSKRKKIILEHLKPLP